MSYPDPLRLQQRRGSGTHLSEAGVGCLQAQLNSGPLMESSRIHFWPPLPWGHSSSGLPLISFISPRGGAWGGVEGERSPQMVLESPGTANSWTSMGDSLAPGFGPPLRLLVHLSEITRESSGQTGFGSKPRAWPSPGWSSRHLTFTPCPKLSGTRALLRCVFSLPFTAAK